MSKIRFALIAFVFLAVGALPANASHPAHGPLELAAAVERRAAQTDFASLEAFGAEAERRGDREGLNRLYHVTWIILNQGEFERAAAWNRRLAAEAARQHDRRYQAIAHLNELTIRYDQGETAVAEEMGRIAGRSDDWFVRAHATRIYALALMDEDRIGEALHLLTDMSAEIPASDPYAATAHAGLWEMVGMGMMKLNDFEGAAAAFGRFELDYSDPAYPRPDFDSLYNLTRMAAEVGDLDLARQLYEAHHRLSVRANLESLSVYDANLCAMVAAAEDRPAEVLRCLVPYGVDLGPAAFLAPQMLPRRAIAYARTGRLAEARRDLAEIRRRQAAGTFREEGYSEVPVVEAEVLFAAGQADAAYRLLRDYRRGRELHLARRFSAGIHQVTGDMQAQLDERRRQLETARANTELQRDVINSQRWVVGFAVVFLFSAGAVLAWQVGLTARLREARRRAEAANQAKSEFLANMSHEIRTPLNGVVAMADALTRSKLPKREREMVEVIRTSGVTLERLLSDILDSAKIESGQITLDPAPFDLGDSVRDLIALWRPRAEEQGVDLQLVVYPGAERRVIGDVVRVRQVLGNLVNNALKFTAQGAVKVTVAPVGPNPVRFTVEDTGVGFDEAQKARIFARFQQADGSITRRFGGTGLGLAISRDLVELMGGVLDCEGRPGEGATFWFEVPLPTAPEAGETAVAESDAAPAEPVRAEDASELPEAPLRILLADDHPANRKVVEVMLSEVDCELVPVVNGQEAVDAFAAGRFDLVLMDMQMPVMDGLAATTELRRIEAAEGRPRTPVIMLTANAMAEHVEAGRQAGADGHLSKPITVASLHRAIAEALAGAPAPAESARTPEPVA